MGRYTRVDEFFLYVVLLLVDVHDKVSLWYFKDFAVDPENSGKSRRRRKEKRLKYERKQEAGKAEAKGTYRPGASPSGVAVHLARPALVTHCC